MDYPLPEPSLAARYNRKMLRGLNRKIKKEPDIDIRTYLSEKYSITLASYKTYPQNKELLISKSSSVEFDIRSRLSSTDSCTIIRDLSPRVRDLLKGSDNLAMGLVKLLKVSEVIFQSAWEGACTVVRVSQDIAVKITSGQSAMTEVESLLYLDKNLPKFPAPKAHGLVKLGHRCLLFMTFAPGLSLETAWPQLDTSQKQRISMQLDNIISGLRLLPRPLDMPFGGVSGEGCKDIRRTVRMNAQPINDVSDFRDFIFAGQRNCSSTYLQFLRDLKRIPPSTCVFTHGDIRPANIIVEQDGSGWHIAKILDWENSGFYPDYWESVKMTNNLDQTTADDWYLHLPTSISPQRFNVDWLLDKLLDRTQRNS